MRGWDICAPNLGRFQQYLADPPAAKKFFEKLSGAAFGGRFHDCFPEPIAAPIAIKLWSGRSTIPLRAHDACHPNAGRIPSVSLRYAGWRWAASFPFPCFV